NRLEIISGEIALYCAVSFHIELVVVKPDVATPSNEPVANDLRPADDKTVRPNPVLTPSRDSLNPEYTFSTFVVGRNNEFAHAVSYSIAKNPGAENYNPLFIYGPTGMGKTHLLNAVGNHLKEHFPNLTICYCSAERFLNECISSIRRNEMYKFRKKYRENFQVLLVDDVQVLNKGQAVQEE